MELDIDVYFWLVDRGCYDDDQRNKVDMERNKVKMHREHSQRLENGYYIAKLMNILKKSVVKISKKPFSLDPALANMKDNITSTSKQLNWNIICKELKKFGIRVDSEKKAKIIEGRFSLISDILARLFDFDNSGGQSRFLADGVGSEMNYGGGNNSIERDHSNGPNQNDSTNISIDGKESIILQSVKKKNDGKLDPISPLPGGSQAKKEQRSKLPINLNPPSGSPPPNLKSGGKKVQSSTALVNQSVTSLNEMREGKDLADAETTLEFILLSLSQSLGIKPKQAAGLLSNNHKYLIHIAVKGMKGGDYTKIIAWYQTIYGFAKQLTTLIDFEKEQNSLKLTLNILKCGLYSQNADLVITCTRVLSKIGQEINQVGGQLSGLAWDWFTDSGAKGGDQQQMNTNTAVDLDLAKELSGSPSLTNLPAVLSDSGIASCLYAMKKFPSEAVSSVAPVLIHYGKNNYTEFFGYQLRKHFLGETQRSSYIQCVHDIVVAISGSSTMFNDSFVSSGALDDLLTIAIQMADFDPTGNNTPQERVAALAFLADVWELKADRIEENQEVAQAILTVLKRGCRDRMRILRSVSFELMFKLLHHFSVNRNQFAPIIYKSLTFLLIEFHTHVEIREQLIRHFTSLFLQVQTIPVAILCEPLLKQFAIAQQEISFNIFDFEFFGVVANHKRATVAIGLQIIDTMISQATSQVFYANSATSVVLEIVHRFSRERPLHQHMGKVTEALIRDLEDSEKWKKANHSVQGASLDATNTTKKGRTTRGALDALQAEAQTVSLAKKMRERLIVNLLKQLILFGIDLIKEDMRTQLLRTYARLSEHSKIRQPKSLHYLLQLYSSDDVSGGPQDVPQMLQYFVEQEKMKSRKRLQQQALGGPQSLVQDQLDDFLLDTSTNQQLMLAALGGADEYTTQPRRLTKAQLHLEKAMKDIEKIKQHKNERTDKKTLEEELRRVRDEQMKVSAKKQVEKLQIEHGVLPVAGKKQGSNGLTIARGVSVDQRGMALPQIGGQGVDKDGTPLEIKIIKARDIEEVSEINIDERRISLLPADERKGAAQKSTVLKELKEFQLFDLRLEEQKDQDAVRFFVKKHIKVLKNVFTKYANTSGPIVALLTFEDLQKNNQFMSVSEMMKLLKDFNVSTLQAPQKMVMQMFRAINKEILKKKDPGTGPSQSLLTSLDFEGFVEFLMQLAVHMYSYDSAMTPSEYLQKLFDHFRTAANKSGSNLLKLFQATLAEDPGSNLLVSGVLDNQLIAELNKRLAVDPDYKLPDGYVKVTEKEIENSYHIPAYFPIDESKRVAIETLDYIFNKALGVHILEPMAEVRETLKARPILRQMTRDKVMSEITTAQSKNVLAVLGSKRGGGLHRRRMENNKSSNSVDANPLKPSSQRGPNTLLSKDLSKAELLAQQQITTPQPRREPIRPPPPKVQLDVTLKLEVAKQPAKERADYLEAAYALEEMIQAVEKGESKLARLGKGAGKKQPPNKLVGERMKKQEEEHKQKVDERKKLEIRKKLLKEQLDQIKAKKAEKEKDTKAKEEKKKQKEEERKKKAHERLLADMEKLKVEFAQKREAKQAEEAEKKAQEPQPVDPAAKAYETKELLKQRKQAVISQLQAKAEERKEKANAEEAAKSKKEQTEKQQAQQIKQMYQDTKVRAKEIKEKYKEEYQAFKEAPLVQQVFGYYDVSLKQLYDKQAKLDPNAGGLLSYNEYMRMGKVMNIYPGIISSQDYIYIYKTLMKDKKKAGVTVTHDSVLDIQGSRLTYPDFKEAVLKMACLGKLKLGGLTSSTLPEDIKIIEQQQKAKVKQALAGAAHGGVLKKPKDEGDDGNVNEDLLNVFEKEFDVKEMTQQTVENMFKALGLKPDLKLVQAQQNSMQSPGKQGAPKSIRGGGPLQSPLGAGGPSGGILSNTQSVRQSLNGGGMQQQNSNQHQNSLQKQITPTGGAMGDNNQ